MKVGIFGGTFDPIHLGHLITATYVLEKRNLDKIIFIPCFVSPLRIGEKHASSIQRINMIKDAIKDYPHFDVSDIEIKREGISFTIDTINQLREQYSDIELIIGFDNLLVLEKWKSPDEILSLVNIVVLNRKVEEQILENRFFMRVNIVDTPVIEISASQIRNRVSQSLSIDFLVPISVKEYIYKNKLYK